jgi:hypothetical protein
MKDRSRFNRRAEGYVNNGHLKRLASRGPTCRNCGGRTIQLTPEQHRVWLKVRRQPTAPLTPEEYRTYLAIKERMEGRP